MAKSGINSLSPLKTTRWLILVIAPLLITAGLAMSSLFPAAAGTPVSYYLPLFDDTGPFAANQPQLLIQNLGDVDAEFEVYLQGEKIFGPVTLSPQQSYPTTLDGKKGPVKVTSTNGQPLLVSQRIIYGDSLTQVEAVREDELDTSWFLTWYDSVSFETDTIIIAANPGSDTAAVNVYVDGELVGNASIPANSFHEFSFPVRMGGPVRVVSTNDKEIAVSQRLTLQENFNETMAVPNAGLSSWYFWAWYDAQSPHTYSWVTVSNLSDASVFYEVQLAGITKSAFTLGPQDTAMHIREGDKSGPLAVRAWTSAAKTEPASVLASQRLLTNGMFSEIFGTPAAKLGTIDWLPAHIRDEDFQTTLFVANTDPTDSAAVAVYTYGLDEPARQETIDPASAIEVDMPTSSGGPVRVVSTNGKNIIASQSFAPGPGTTYYFPWYDGIYGTTWVLGAQPQTGPLAHDNSIEVFLESGSDSSTLTPNPLAVATGQTQYVGPVARLGGPVKVTTSAGSSLISERSLFGNSFEEVWATDYQDLDSHYYWPQYMSFPDGGLQAWILVSNPQLNGESVTVDLTMKTEDIGDGDPPDVHQIYELGPGQTITPTFPDTVAGSVEVRAYGAGGTARKVIASERILVDGAFNEMPGIPGSSLSDRYFWTWFDSVNTGNLIFIGNPSPSSPIWVKTSIHGVVKIFDQVAAGATVVWEDETASIMDGPVEVQGCLDFACNTPADLYASQMVINEKSVGEIAGTPVSELSPRATWTWYDMWSPGVSNWVLIANPNDQPIYWELTIPGGPNPEGLRAAGTIAAHGRITPSLPGTMGGPVTVSAWTNSGKSVPANVMASQRVLWNGYFNEIVGKGS